MQPKTSLAMRRADYIDANIMQMLTQAHYEPGSVMWHVRHVGYGLSDTELVALTRDVLGVPERKAS